MTEPGLASASLGVRRLRTGIVLSLLFLLTAFVSVAWTPYPVGAVNVGGTLQDWSAAHWLGTDHFGRDLVSMLMKGLLTSLVVAAVGTAMGGVVGALLGIAAASRGRALDWMVLRAVGYLGLFPAMLGALLFAIVAGPGSVLSMCAIGIACVPAFALATRGGLLVLQEEDYVAAARLAGLGHAETMRRHIVPRMVVLLGAVCLTQLAQGVLAEAALSYVGLGAQAPATSLGLMLREAQGYALLKPTLVVAPGLLLALVAGALQLAASGLRMRLDAALQGTEAPRVAA